MRKDRIKEMLVESPNDSFLHFALAKEHEKEEDFEQAIEEYEFIMQADPKYVGLYYHLAAAAIEMDKDPDYIKAIYEKGIEIANDQKDQHSVAELKNAYVNWEMEN